MVANLGTFLTCSIQTLTLMGFFSDLLHQKPRLPQHQDGVVVEGILGVVVSNHLRGFMPRGIHQCRQVDVLRQRQLYEGLSKGMGRDVLGWKNP